jgi:hypothetical protein
MSILFKYYLKENISPIEFAKIVKGIPNANKRYIKLKSQLYIEIIESIFLNEFGTSSYPIEKISIENTTFSP